MKRRKAAPAAQQPATVVTMPQVAAQSPLRSALVLGPAAALLVGALDHIWVTEDAFITFKSVENLWHGKGPNFNAGLRVESFSHPLWFLILSVLRVAGSAALPLLAAVAGILLSVLGLVAATRAASLRLERLSRLAPLGAMLVAALPPFWDFASSGMETGLAFAWIGAVSLLLTLVARDHQPTRVAALFWLLGLGPLIRPDFALPTLPLLALALLLSRSADEGVLPSAARVLQALLPSAAWQLFRMGYYGLTVPNTFLAKEGFMSRWGQGFVYLNDLYLMYWLYPVVALLLALSALSCIASAKRCVDRTESFAAWAIPMALTLAGLLHSLAVIRTGGDFMHARLLLPGLFFFASASAVVSLPGQAALRWLTITACSVWAFGSAVCIRPPYRYSISSNGIADERAWYAHRAQAVRPVTLNDYRYHSYFRIGEETSRMARSQNFKAVYWAHIGIAVAALSEDIVVIDPLGLNDHISSHIELTERGRPGHEKIARAAWFFARYPAGVGMVVRNQLDDVFRKPETPEAIAAARAVLSSPQLAELTEAVSAPLTWDLFWRNVRRAQRLTGLRIPADPEQALQLFGSAATPDSPAKGTP